MRDLSYISTTPHPIDDVRHNGLGWRDMPGACEVFRKMNFFFFRRGLYNPHEDDTCRGGVTKGRKNAARKVYEQQILLRALQKNGGNVLAACRSCGISRHTHNYYMQQEPEYAELVRDIKRNK